LPRGKAVPLVGRELYRHLPKGGRTCCEAGKSSWRGEEKGGGKIRDGEEKKKTSASPGKGKKNRSFFKGGKGWYKKTLT